MKTYDGDKGECPEPPGIPEDYVAIEPGSACQPDGRVDAEKRGLTGEGITMEHRTKAVLICWLIMSVGVTLIAFTAYVAGVEAPRVYTAAGAAQAGLVLGLSVSWWRAWEENWWNKLK